MVFDHKYSEFKHYYYIIYNIFVFILKIIIKSIGITSEAPMLVSQRRCRGGNVRPITTPADIGHFIEISFQIL